ncbi:hypothetical protein B0H12DRAFT_1232906 [Mycena haematopus]|nr:hypothetical protein B0H12DRAFT_1232906 [Mycena haematopus]
MSFIVTPVEQALDHDTPFESTPIDDAHLDAAFDALVTQKPIDAIYNALYEASPFAADVYYRSPIDDIRLDAAVHALGAEAPLADVFAILFNITLTDPPPEDSEVSEFTVPYIPAPSPYGMGLSFEESSDWRAPVWRSPESSAIDSTCVDPRLILPNPPDSPPRRAASASSDDDMAVADFSISFETPEAVPVDSDSDEDDSDDSDNDSDEPQDDTDSDFEERPKRTRAPRTTRPLPRRVAPKAAVPSPRARTSRASAPVSQRSTHSSSASSSASTAFGKKRKATRASGRRASKKVAVSFQLPHIAGVTDPDLPAPANSTGVCATYWPLLRLGCTVIATGVRCNIDGCKKETNCWGDMGRHVPALHYRDQMPQLGCKACPYTFARSDAQSRHILRFTNKGRHFTNSRKAFLIEFNKLPKVIDMRNNCAGDSASYKKLNKELNELFEELRPKAPKA